MTCEARHPLSIAAVRDAWDVEDKAALTCNYCRTNSGRVTLTRCAVVAARGRCGDFNMCS